MARTVSSWIALAVLAIHLMLLQVLGSLAPQPSALRAMATPFFTRELQASAPPRVIPTLAQKRPGASQKHRPFATNIKANEMPEPSAPEDITKTAAVTTTATATTTLTADLALPDANEITGASPPTTSEAATTLTPTAVVGPSGAGTTVTSAATATAAVNAGSTAPPDTWPLDTRLNYDMTGNYRGPITGTARVQWQRDGGRYQVRVSLDVSGVTLYSMTSQGRVTPQGLAPEAYEENRLGTKPQVVTMAPQQIRLNDASQVDRPDEAQDTASQFVELGHRFATGRAALEVGKSVQMWLARPNMVAEWTYDIVALDTVKSTHLGEVPAYHLKPRPLDKPTGPITAEMWFAPSLQYLPVRIRITMNADTWVDMQIEKIEQVEQATTPAVLAPPVKP